MVFNSPFEKKRKSEVWLKKNYHPVNCFQLVNLWMPTHTFRFNAVMKRHEMYIIEWKLGRRKMNNIEFTEIYCNRHDCNFTNTSPFSVHACQKHNNVPEFEFVCLFNYHLQQRAVVKTESQTGPLDHSSIWQQYLKQETTFEEETWDSFNYRTLISSCWNIHVKRCRKQMRNDAFTGCS